MTTVLVLAPHPDDETLGCGGTLLKHKQQNDPVHWVIATSMTTQAGYDPERIESRRRTIAKVTGAYDFSSVHELGFQATRMDGVAEREIVEAIAGVLSAIGPETVYLPFPGDAHGDHKAVYSGAAACLKWFRQPSVRRVLSYETISETDASLSIGNIVFSPNVFVDISDHLERKIDIMKMYDGEMEPFPFPRSPEAITALARMRGAATGTKAAEAFMLLRERS